MKSIIDLSALFTDLDTQKRSTVVPVIGAGGKTSLLFRLAELFQVSGRRVLTTTTIHIFIPTSHWPVVFRHDPAMLPHTSFISLISFYFHRWKMSQGKAQGFTPEAIDVLIQRPECGVTLIKTDSSCGIPLKASGEHEPCMPKSSCCVVVMMGGHILGAKVSTEDAHRWSQFADITGLMPDVSLQLSNLVALIRHPQRAFKNVP